MSLTSELRCKDSPVGRSLRETFRQTRGPLAECREALRVPLVSRLFGDALAPKVNPALTIGKNPRCGTGTGRIAPCG